MRISLGKGKEDGERGEEEGGENEGRVEDGEREEDRGGMRERRW